MKALYGTKSYGAADQGRAHPPESGEEVVQVTTLMSKRIIERNADVPLRQKQEETVGVFLAAQERIHVRLVE